jgi:hypothetical protein
MCPIKAPLLDSSPKETTSKGTAWNRGLIPLQKRNKYGTEIM